MHGQQIDFSVTWADIGSAVGYFEDDSEETFQTYIERVLNGDRDLKTYRASEPKTTAERKQEDVTWRTLALLVLANAPLTLSGLAAMQHTAIPLVREGVAQLERRGLVVFAKKSRLVFRTLKEQKAP